MGCLKLTYSKDFDGYNPSLLLCRIGSKGHRPKSQKRTKVYSFGFNGQEKDDEVSGAGNTTTAMFWEYDARLGRRWNIDPKHYANESPYSVMGDNPICRTDINGDKWKDKADANKAKSLDKELVKRERELSNEASRNEKMAKKFEKKDPEKSAEYSNLAKIAREGQGEMVKARQELIEMGSEATAQVFHFEEIDASAPSAKTYMDMGGVINMQYVYGEDALALHEANHGYAQLSGRMLFTPAGAKFVDIHDEVRAYRRQFFVLPSSVLGLKLDNGETIKTYQRITPEIIHKVVIGTNTPYFRHSDNDLPMLNEPGK